MKLYSTYHKSSIKMTDDIKFTETLNLLANKNKVNVIIESGTYLGTGSTLALYKAFHNSSNFEMLYTCEVNSNFHKIAKKNLTQFSKVICLNGRTVKYKEAKNFISTDPVLKNHSIYPDVFIDDINNPVEFYLKELEGNLGGFKKNTFKEKVMNFIFPLKEDLLKQLIIKNINKTLLIVLDSAGGLGYLEFLTVIKLLKNNSYYLLLDDIHHLKHFRSYVYLKKDKNFEIIDFDFSNGWLLAIHLL